MALLPLHKEVNLAELLEKLGLQDKQKLVQSELPYYDEYYISPSSSFLKLWNQEFISDPYIKSRGHQAVKIVNCSGQLRQQDIDEITLKSSVPVIVRTPLTQNLSGLRPLLNKKGQETLLIPVELVIPVAPVSAPYHVRPMNTEDIRTIEKMLQNEYSLRYRAVPLLWADGYDSSFVYHHGDIGGLCFNSVVQSELHMRQLFVPKSHRGKGIGKALYHGVLKFAQKRQFRVLRANIRKEAKLFHHQFDAYEDITQPIQQYLISGELK